MQKPEKRIIISGGGTGGHIFPAIAIAGALKAIAPDVNILFVGAIGKMEMEKVPAAGFPIKGIPVRGFQRRMAMGNLWLPFRILASLLKAWRILKEFNPGVVVGVGGYASGPVLRMAASMGIPTLIQEQNSYAGITNRLLAKKARKIAVAYAGMEKFFPANKIILCGNPVRNDIMDLVGKKQEASLFFKLDPQKPTILATGGSLGARTINETIESLLSDFKARDIQLIWQCGKLYYEKIKHMKVEFDGQGIVIEPFISRMDLAYAIADLVVSRAGAIAISELCMAGKPSILIPSPNVTEDHQTHNALALVKENAAILIRDVDARQNLGQTMFDLINDKQQCQTLALNIKKQAYPDASVRIAQEILTLLT